MTNVRSSLAASQQSAYFRGWTDALLTAYEEIRTMETCSGITAVEVRKDALKAIDVCKGFVTLREVRPDDEHLPECLLSRPRSVDDCSCVCHLLRACEQRVLDAARKAVAGLRTYGDHGEVIPPDEEAAVIYVTDALAAIDALREKP